jgi:peroxiredoxin
MTDSPISDAVEKLQGGQTGDDVWGREAAALRERPAPSTLAIGKRFPDGDLLTATGEPTTLAATLSGAAGVVVFYRGAWCPYCNLALAAYRDDLNGPLRDRGIVLVAVSPQVPDGSMTIREKHSLDFAVLSDPGSQIGTALGIVARPSEEYIEAQLAQGMDLTELNADGTINLPMPTVAIVDAAGRLAWMDVHPDYSTRTEPAEVLAALASLGLC